MKNRKRLCIVLALSLLLVILIGVVMLVQKQDPNVPTVGVCMRQLSDGDSQEYYNLLEARLHYSGFKTMSADANNDQSKQDSQIAQMLKKGCDILVVEPVMVTAADTVVKQLQQADVPLIFINREPSQQVLDSWDKLCYVGCDIANAGAVQGSIAAALPQKGDINGDGVTSYVILQADPSLADTQTRSESCIGAMTQAGMTVSCLQTVSTGGSKDSGQLHCASLLAQYGKDIEVIICHTDEIALGALEAVKEGGWTPGVDVYILGIGGSAAAVEAVGQGTLTGTVIRDTNALCEQVLSTVTQMLAGTRNQKVVYVDYLPVTKPEPVAED